MNNTPSHANVYNSQTGQDCRRKVTGITADEHGRHVGNIKLAHARVQVALCTVNDLDFWVVQ
jgi:hypothetical protein